MYSPAIACLTPLTIVETGLPSFSNCPAQYYTARGDVHRQIFEGDETIDCAFTGRDAEAADNRWLREAKGIRFQSSTS